MNSKGFFRKTFKSIFFIGCLTFVLWQCYYAFDRYLQKPISIFKFIDSATNWPLPRITICPPMDASYLENICKLDHEEWNGGQWTGQYDENVIGKINKNVILKIFKNSFFKLQAVMTLYFF